MKIKLLIILSILIQISCQEKKNELERSWIIVETKKKPKSGFIPGLRGLVCHFDDDKWYFSFTPFYEKIEENYVLDNGYIKTDSNRLGKILYLSKDSLIIEADSSRYDMHFRPLEEITFSPEERNKLYQQLMDNTWELYDSKFQTNNTFYFNDKVLGEEYKVDKWTKSMFYESQFEDSKWLENAKWILKEINGKLLFSYHHGLIHGSPQFQITAFNEETIQGNFLSWESNDWSKNEMKIIARKSEVELESMKESIKGNWATNELVSPAEKEINNLRNSKVIPEVGIGYLRFESRIMLSDLEKRNLKMQLALNGDYKILAGDKIIRKGNQWGFTRDGSYLYLDSVIGDHNIFEIKSFQENRFTIKFNQRIGIRRDKELLWSFVHLEVDFIREG